MIILNAKSGEVIAKEGEICDKRNSPASTFKVPLALMGFESGILQDSHNPSWPYKEGYPAWRESWKQSVDPTYWEDQSVVWFSQELTRKLGKEQFQKYTDELNYGNRDLSGDPGKDNGLLRSWISSSLTISPNEQVDFLLKMVNQSCRFRKWPPPKRWLSFRHTSFQMAGLPTAKQGPDMRLARKVSLIAAASSAGMLDGLRRTMKGSIRPPQQEHASGKRRPGAHNAR